MDRVAEYKEHIKSILREYAAIKPTYGDVDVELILDDERGHYELWHIGWDGSERIHGCILHVDLRGDKIWIQHDGTEDGIATELIDAGVPPTQIVLGFHRPSERRHTPFATA